MTASAGSGGVSGPGDSPGGPTVVCVGHAVLDQVFRVDRLPSAEGKYFATDREEVGGGPAATGAVTVARLGGIARLIARLGEDGAARTILDQLAADGVDTALTRCFAGHKSSVSAVLVDPSGERLIVNHADPDLPEGAAWLPADAIRAADAVLADRRWEAGALAALTLARQAGKPAILDADRGPTPVPADLIAAADHVVFSADGLAQVTGRPPEPSDLDTLAPDAAVVAVTLGKDGVVWRHATGRHRLPAFPIAVVDTLGAGDVFHGAYAHAIAAGHPVAEAMRLAAATAAVKCTRSGGRAGIPTAADLDRFLKDHAA